MNNKEIFVFLFFIGVLIIIGIWFCNIHEPQTFVSSFKVNSLLMFNGLQDQMFERITYKIDKEINKTSKIVGNYKYDLKLANEKLAKAKKEITRLELKSAKQIDVLEKRIVLLSGLLVEPKPKMRRKRR